MSMQEVKEPAYGHWTFLVETTNSTQSPGLLKELGSLPHGSCDVVYDLDKPIAMQHAVRVHIQGALSDHELQRNVEAVRRASGGSAVRFEDGGRWEVQNGKYVFYRVDTPYWGFKQDSISTEQENAPSPHTDGSSRGQYVRHLMERVGRITNPESFAPDNPLSEIQAAMRAAGDAFSKSAKSDH